MIKLGDTVTDTITEFTGVVIGKCQYPTRRIQFKVQPKGLKDGRPIKPEWIDEERLEYASVRSTPPL